MNENHINKDLNLITFNNRIKEILIRWTLNGDNW